VTADNPGVTGHATITMDESDASTTSASGGAAYVIQPAAGATGTAAFALLDTEEFVTFTIGVAPAGY
jgi:hypothetical protein